MDHILYKLSILFNKRSTGGGYYAYHIWYDYGKKTIEFRAWGRTGGGTAATFTLVNKPYQERWYHVAVTRAGLTFKAYVDGRERLTANINVGDTSSNQGASIGGSDSLTGYRDLHGEIQEVSIYQMALQEDQIEAWMFENQPPLQELMGYFKLGYSTNRNDHYKNFAPNPPSGTDPAVTVGTGSIVFEQTDQKGEQSIFDSQVNGGRNAVTPLSGSFAWQQPVLKRPVPGVPFEFSIGYSANAEGALGQGWNHSFDTKVEADSLTYFKILTCCFLFKFTVFFQRFLHKLYMNTNRPQWIFYLVSHTGCKGSKRSKIFCPPQTALSFFPFSNIRDM